MKNNLIILGAAALLSFAQLTDLEAARGGGGGGHGGGGGGHMGGGGARFGGGGAHSLQRSPSMSRVSHSAPAARPNTARAPATAARAQGQSSGRSQISQFAKSNPVAARPNNVSQNAAAQNRSQARQNLNQVGNNVRNNVGRNYADRGSWFNQGFWNNHNFQPAYGYGNWWGEANAANVGTWLGWNGQPAYYGVDNGYFGPTDYSADAYGDQNNVQSTNNVYANQSNEAQNNTTSAPVAVNSSGEASNGDWLALGVYSISRNGENVITPNMFLQLALNKNGDISGALYNTTTNQVHEVTGGVDQDSQRAIWKMADNPGSPVVETGIYNLTQNEAPVQIHFQNGVVENRLLVRVKN